MIRILTGLLLAYIAWVLAFYAPAWALVAAIVAVTVLALREFFAIIGKFGLKPFHIAGQAAGAVWLLTPNLDRGYAATLLAVLLLSGTAFARVPVREFLPTAGVTLLGVVYIAGPMLYGILLHGISPHWFAFVLVVVGIGDSVALAVGKTWGRRALAPIASPHKTWEGTVASLVFGILSGAGYAAEFMGGEVHWIEGAVAGAVFNAVGQIGDLAESIMKRAAGVKDSSHILPGHGGVLDRIDGLLFAIPVAYGYLAYLR